MKCTKSSLTSASSKCTARIAAIRPRGDNASSPVTRNVGQWGRHRPQLTQEPRRCRRGEVSRCSQGTRNVTISMPEGHTVHRIAIDHSKVLRGKHVAVSSPQGRFAADAALVDGARLTRIEAYGKHLFYLWGNGLGRPRPPRLVRQVPRPPRRARPTTYRPCACASRFRKQPSISRGRRTARSARRKIEIGSCSASVPTRCRDDAEPHLAYEAIARRVAPIGQLLLEQKVMSGVGNVYRAEALFVNGIHPGRPGTEITRRDVRGAVVDDRRDAAPGRGRRPHRHPGPRRVRGIRRHAARRGDTTYVYHRDPLLALWCADPHRRSRRPALLLLPGLPAEVSYCAFHMGRIGVRRARSATALGPPRPPPGWFVRHECASGWQRRGAVRRSPRRAGRRAATAHSRRRIARRSRVRHPNARVHVISGA